MELYRRVLLLYINMTERILMLQLASIAILIGLATNRLAWASVLIILLLSFAVVTTIKYREPMLLLVVVIGIFLGGNRSLAVWSDLSLYQKYFSQYVSLEGVVLDDAIYGYKKQVEFYIDNIQINNGEELPGKLRISGYGLIEVKRGDKVEVSGKLRPGYGSYQGRISYADYEVLGRTDSLIENYRHKFIADTYSVLPEPQASLGLGFLAGFRSLLPDDLEDNLSTTGLTHIVAVSGYNTTILASAVQTLLAKRGSRKQVVFATLGLLLIFMSITGAAPSIVRASVVSGLSLIAWYFGRRFRPSVLLLVSAAATAYMSPLYLWYGLGWWLSFLAFFGVLIVAPLISKRFFKNKPGVLTQTALETTSAQLMTLPLIIWIFGKVSAIALLANLLVLPVIPLAMLTTFVAGTLAMTGMALAGIVAWPARFVLSYITDVINLLAKIPWALHLVTATRAQMLMMYGAIGAIVWLIYNKLQLSRSSHDEIY